MAADRAVSNTGDGSLQLQQVRGKIERKRIKGAKYISLCSTRGNATRGTIIDSLDFPKMDVGEDEYDYCVRKLLSAIRKHGIEMLGEKQYLEKLGMEMLVTINQRIFHISGMYVGEDKAKNHGFVFIGDGTWYAYGAITALINAKVKIKPKEMVKLAFKSASEYSWAIDDAFDVISESSHP